MGLSNTLSHFFRKAWCYLWREHGLLTSVVFCLLAFGMQSTAFAPENLTQICVCGKGSKDLIIFWELYYLSFANQVILQTEKMLCMTQPRLLLSGVDCRPEIQKPCPQAWACPESELTGSSSPHASVSPVPLFKSGKLTKSNAHLTLLDGCLHWAKCVDKAESDRHYLGLDVSMTCNISKCVFPSNVSGSHHICLSWEVDVEVPLN